MNRSERLPEVIPSSTSLHEIVREKYELLDIALSELYEQKSTFENDDLLDDATQTMVLYDTICSVAAAHSEYCKDVAVQEVAFEAFWLAAQIASVLPHKPVFAPGSYFQAPPNDLAAKMAKDSLEYLADKPYISTLIDEQVDTIDPTDMHHAMVDSFTAVVLMHFEQGECSEDSSADIDKEFARLLLHVDTDLEE